MRKQTDDADSLARILRSTAHNGWTPHERAFAEQELRRIYSEQLARLLQEKKFYLLNSQHRAELDRAIETRTTLKMQSTATMQERSEERRDKLLKDRVKFYEANDKRWHHKKEEIRSRVADKEKSMREVAKDYRLKSEHYWREREIQTKQILRQSSQKHHHLYNSNLQSARTKDNRSDMDFDQARYEELIARRQSRFSQFRHHTRQTDTFREHQEKERTLTATREKEHFQKLVDKLAKIENIELKKQDERRKESLKKAKEKLHQKVYPNNQPDVGEVCRKHDIRESRFRAKTLANESIKDSQVHMRTSLSRSSVLSDKKEDPVKEKHAQSMSRYCEKAKQLKISKMLKLNVRNMLNGQFRKAHLLTQP